VNFSFYEDGRRILELSKRLYSLYVRANYEEKARILKAIASNYTLRGATFYPTYRKPFDILAEGRSCPGWLPGLDKFRNFLWMEEGRILASELEELALIY